MANTNKGTQSIRHQAGVEPIYNKYNAEMLRYFR